MPSDTLLTVKPSTPGGVPMFFIVSKPEIDDAKFLIVSAVHSIHTKPTKKMLQLWKHNRVFMLDGSKVNVSKIQDISCVDEFFYHYELYGHQNIEMSNKCSSQEKETLLKNQRGYLHPLSRKFYDQTEKIDIDYSMPRMLWYRMLNPLYNARYKYYQQYLYHLFQKNTFSSQHELNYNYTLFIHCVTNPNGIQIWRKVILNGRLTLKQVDKILKIVIGYTFTGITHMTEFRINCDQNPLTHKISLNL
eukprot:78509_1